jgi:hypothetical protein
MMHMNGQRSFSVSVHESVLGSALSILNYMDRDMLKLGQTHLSKLKPL